jgi:hypothetical protein
MSNPAGPSGMEDKAIDHYYLPYYWGDLPKPVVATRAHVRAWIDLERARYADNQQGGKFQDGTPGGDLRDEIIKGGEWTRTLTFVMNYVKRAELMGLDSEQGRQALGKAITSATNILEKAVEFYGPMPDPGHSSGEVQPWLNCPYPRTSVGE